MGGKGAAIDKKEPESQSIQFQTSAYGRSIPLVYGRNRLAGNIIAAGNPLTLVVKNGDFVHGGFGASPPSSTTNEFYISVWIALCEGPIRRIRLGYREEVQTAFSYGSIWEDFEPAIEIESPLAEREYEISTQIINCTPPGNGAWYFRGTAEQRALTKTGYLDLRETSGGRLFTFPPDVGTSVTGAPPLSYPFTSYWVRPVWPLDNQPQIPNLMFEVEGLFPGPIYDRYEIANFGAITWPGSNDGVWCCTGPLVDQTFYIPGITCGSLIGPFSQVRATIVGPVANYTLSFTDLTLRRRLGQLDLEEPLAYARITDGDLWGYAANVDGISSDFLNGARALNIGTPPSYRDERYWYPGPVEDRQGSSLTIDGGIGRVQGSVPADIVIDMLTHPIRGATAQLSEHLGNFTLYANYSLAEDILLNMAMIEPKPAAEWLSEILVWTHSEAVFSQGFLKIFPKGDAALKFRPQYREDLYDNVPASRYEPLIPDPAYDEGPRKSKWTRMYVPPELVLEDGEEVLNVLFHLDEDDFGEGEDAVEVTPAVSEETANVITVEYKDRNNKYNETEVDWTNDALIVFNGRREESPISAPGITYPEAAEKLAALIGQERSAQRNKYTFSLSWRFALLDPWDIVTITFPPLELERVPVRITNIEEDEEGRLKIEALEIQTGLASVAQYNHQSSEFIAPDLNETPSNTLPKVFEPPFMLARGQFSIWIVCNAFTERWGGCEIHMSVDRGISYIQKGEIRAPTAAFGRVSATWTPGPDIETVLFGRRVVLNNTPLQVTLTTPGATLPNYSSVEAITFQNPFMLGTKAAYEIIAYETATLVSTDSAGRNTYSLSRIIRQGFGTASLASANLGLFCVSLEDRHVFKIPVTTALKGRNLRFKFPAFNSLLSQIQEISDLTPISFRPTGHQFCIGTPPVEGLRIVALDSSGGFDLRWDETPNLIIDPFYEIRKIDLPIPTAIQAELGFEPTTEDIEELWGIAPIYKITRETRAPLQGDGIYIIAFRCGDPVDATFAQVASSQPTGYGPKRFLRVEGTEDFIDNKIVTNVEVPAEGGEGNYNELIEADPHFLHYKLGDYPSEPDVYDYVSEARFPSGVYIGPSVEFRLFDGPTNTRNDYHIRLRAGAASGVDNDTYIELPNAPDDRLEVAAGEDWWHGFWYKNPDLGSGGAAQYACGRAAGFWVGIAIALGNSYVFFQPDSGSSPNLFLTGHNLHDGDWHYIVTRYRASDSQLDMFVDGDRGNPSLGDNTYVLPAQTGSFFIGRSGVPGGLPSEDYLQGEIWGFSFHKNSRVTEREAKSLYRAASYSNPDRFQRIVLRKDPEILLKFDEREDHQVADASENRFDGTFLPAAPQPEPQLVTSLLHRRENLARDFNSFDTEYVLANDTTTRLAGSIVTVAAFTSLSLTFMTMIRRNNSNQHWLFGFNENGGSQHGFQVFVDSSDRLNAWLFEEGTGLQHSVQGALGFEITPGGVYHVAARYDASTGDITLFVNGEIAGVTNVGATGVNSRWSTIDEITMAAAVGGLSPMDGTLDEPWLGNAVSDARMQEYAASALESEDYENTFITPEGYIEVLPQTTGYYYSTKSPVLTRLSALGSVRFTSRWELFGLNERNFGDIPLIREAEKIGRRDLGAYVGGHAEVHASPADALASVSMSVNPAKPNGFLSTGLAPVFIPPPQPGDIFEVPSEKNTIHNAANVGRFTVVAASETFVQVEETLVGEGDGLWTDVSWWGPWQKIDADANLYGKRFETRFCLNSTGFGVRSVLTYWDWTADIPEVVRSGEVTLPASPTAIVYSAPFTSTPDLIVTIVDPDAGDYVDVTSPTATGFTVQVLSGTTGNPVAKTVRYFARGV